MKSKELKVYNLPSDSLLSVINAKPSFLLSLLLIIGCVSFAFDVPEIYGVLLIIISFLCICFLPKVPLMEFYKDYFIMYNRADRDTCMMIYYDDVVSWHYAWSAKKDTLIVELTDGSVEKIEAFSKTLFETNMYIHLREKHKKAQ